MPDSPARGRRGPTNPKDDSNVRVQKPMGLPPIYEDCPPPPKNGGWTPGIQGLDPRCTKTGAPRNKNYKTHHPPDEDEGLRVIQDVTGRKTSCDSGLRGIQDFAGLGTSWDLGLRRKQELRTRILWCSLGEHKLSG